MYHCPHQKLLFLYTPLIFCFLPLFLPFFQSFPPGSFPSFFCNGAFFLMSSFPSATVKLNSECLRALWPFLLFAQLLDSVCYSEWWWHTHKHTCHSYISVLCIYLFSSVFLVFCCCIKLFRPTCPVENTSFINKVSFYDQQILCWKSSHLSFVSI